MPAPVTIDAFVNVVQQSGLIAPVKFASYLQQLYAESGLPADPPHFAARMVRDGLLSNFQAQQLLKGRYRHFTIGKYRILEPLGSGGMGKVFLAEHVTMGHRVAMKILPNRANQNSSLIERFHREAQASGALNHPNIVRAHDIDRDGDRFHYIIMDYVEGVNLFDYVRKKGPLSVAQAAHYAAQAAVGLQYMFEAGLVHRDITPGNLLLDRQGTIKILDLGLAQDKSEVERVEGTAVLGTADYMAPEQVAGKTRSDIRADIYSLGATCHYLLTGRTPPRRGQSIAEKLLPHQARSPGALGSLRPDLPADFVDVVERAMARSPNDRFQRPIDVAMALAPWTATTIAPPAEEDLPRRSPMSKGMSSYTGPKSGLGIASDGAADTQNGSKQPAPRSALMPGSPTPIPRRAVAAPLPLTELAPARWSRWPYLAAAALVMLAVLAAAFWPPANVRPPAAAPAPPSETP